MTENRCRSCSQHERIADLRARLAEAEAERDALASKAARIFERSADPDPLLDENADLRARLDLMTREARLSREATDRAVARLAENEVAFRKMAEAAEAYSRELHKAKAALARVLAVPACRDVGHTEALHIAAGCCDPYESSACTIFAPLDHPRSER